MAPSSSNIFFLLSLMIMIISSTLADNNIMFTNDSLTANEQLTYNEHQFVMQADCNLVLYGGASNFTSKTYKAGKDCSLTLNNQGRLLVVTGDGKTVWVSNNYSNRKGLYVAVLRPDGEIAVYGPQLWSTIPKPSGVGSPHRHRPQSLSNSPSAKNILFSGQVLYDDGAIRTRDYSFVMESNCNAKLVKATYYGEIWQSRTAGNGQGCFMRLNHYGQLTIVDDMYRPVWNSSAPQVEDYGEYVLVVQYNNRATVYGPKVWTTAVGGIGGIAMKV